MEQIVLAYGLPKETVTAITLLSKTSDEDTDFFDIVAGVLQGDILVLYLFIIRLDYVLRTSIDLMKKMVLLEKKKMLTIPRTNYNGCRLRR